MQELFWLMREAIISRQRQKHSTIKLPGAPDRPKSGLQVTQVLKHFNQLSSVTLTIQDHLLVGEADDPG